MSHLNRLTVLLGVLLVGIGVVFDEILIMLAGAFLAVVGIVPFIRG